MIGGTKLWIRTFRTMKNTAGRVTIPGFILAHCRMVGVMLALAWYISGFLISSRFTSDPGRTAFRYRKKFTGTSMRILGVKASYSGEPARRPALYVSNHRSLLDPFVELHRINAFVVSKAEVSSYPLIGYSVAKTGVIFVQRDEVDSRQRARVAIGRALTEGTSILIYPEGTTGDQLLTQEFKQGAFAMALEGSHPVVPVALHYGRDTDNWASGSLYWFFVRKFGHWRTTCELRIGEPITDAISVEELVERSRQWVNTQIEQMRGGEVFTPVAGSV